MRIWHRQRLPLHFHSPSVLLRTLQLPTFPSSYAHGRLRERQTALVRHASTGGLLPGHCGRLHTGTSFVASSAVVCVVRL